MRFIGLVFVFALLSTAPLASAQKAIDITPYSIAGIHLGMSQARRVEADDQAAAARPARGRLRAVRLAETEGGGVLPQGHEGRCGVTTWNRQLQTDEQIGPCTMISALKQAYRSRLKSFQQGLGPRRTVSATSSSP